MPTINRKRTLLFIYYIYFYLDIYCKFIFIFYIYYYIIIIIIIIIKIIGNMRFHGNNRYANAPHCDVKRTLFF
jgi:hypothetical protein